MVFGEMFAAIEKRQTKTHSATRCMVSHQFDAYIHAKITIIIVIHKRDKTNCLWNQIHVTHFLLFSQSRLLLNHLPIYRNCLNLMNLFIQK